MDIKLKEDEVLVLVTEYGYEENILPKSGYFELSKPKYGNLWGNGILGDQMKNSNCFLIKAFKKDINISAYTDYSVEIFKGEVVYWGDSSKIITSLLDYWLTETPKGSKASKIIGDKCHSYTTTEMITTCTTGDNSHCLSTGDFSHSITTGESSASVTLGDGGYSLTTGVWSPGITHSVAGGSITTGDDSTACSISPPTSAPTYATTKGSRSNSCAIADMCPMSMTTGDFSNSIAVSKSVGAMSYSSGDGAHSIALGTNSTSSATGKNSIACVLAVGEHLSDFPHSNRAKSGETGAIVMTYFDETANRMRIKVAYPGENGIKPNTYYEFDKSGNFIESEDQDDHQYF